MALYRKQYFIKDKKGKWVKTLDKVEKAPHDVGRWLRTSEISKKSKEKEKTFFTSQTTKGGLNKKVISVSTYFGDNEKVVYNLITTSNKLPLKVQDSLKGVKDMKIYCK